jgi:predicted  nucleic acid-binding Zn-ribbon protein
MLLPPRGGPVSPELERLLALRGLDTHLKRYDENLGSLPRRLKATEQQLMRAREELDAHRQHLKQLALKRSEGEHEVEALATEERKFEGRTPEVKTNEELRALRKEIEDIQGKRSELETRVLENMELEDAERRRIPELQRQLTDAEAADESERKAIAVEQVHLEEGRDDVTRQRNALLEEMQADLRTRYERVQKAHGAEAVVPLLKGACGGCSTKQPPQRVQEVRSGDRLVICEFCGRIIVGMEGEARQ